MTTDPPWNQELNYIYRRWYSAINSWHSWMPDLIVSPSIYLVPTSSDVPNFPGCFNMTSSGWWVSICGLTTIRWSKFDSSSLFHDQHNAFSGANCRTAVLRDDNVIVIFTQSKTACMLTAVVPMHPTSTESNIDFHPFSIQSCTSCSFSGAPHRSSLPTVRSMAMIVLMLYPLSPEITSYCPDQKDPSLLPCPKPMLLILSCSLVLHPPRRNWCSLFCSWFFLLRHGSNYLS